MAEIKITKTETTEMGTSEMTVEVKDIEITADMVTSLFGREKKSSESGAWQRTIEQKENNEIDHDVVVVYDNAGIPSIMHRFRRIMNKELFGGSDKPHPAFVIGGEIYDEIYISVYENSCINGKPYSLPYRKSWTNITNDDAAAACFSKGDGWHLMTAAEWGMLANLSLRNRTLPHGNTYEGKYHAGLQEHGGVYGKYYTFTGSGPVTWTHNHTPEGVHDLCGNHWEMVRGLRIVDGELQAARDNNAALDIDLSRNGNGWENIKDKNGKPIWASVDTGITLTTNRDIARFDAGVRWKDVVMACDSEQLKELAMYKGEPDADCFIYSTKGEFFPIRGGGCNSHDFAGVFNINLIEPRTYAYDNIGFRSAYFRKKERD